MEPNFKFIFFLQLNLELFTNSKNYGYFQTKKKCF